MSSSSSTLAIHPHDAVDRQADRRQADRRQADRRQADRRHADRHGEVVRWDDDRDARWPTSTTTRYEPYTSEEYERIVSGKRQSPWVGQSASRSGAAAAASTDAIESAERLPIVIDHGGFEVRAGFAHEQEPRLRFRNLVARPKTKRNNATTRIGNQMSAWEAWRLKPRNSFDGDLLTFYDTMETILDYTFASLGLGRSERIDHPLVLTEPLANPNYCRSRVSELLFEGYGAPSVAYGVDMLFALHENHRRGLLSTHLSSTPSSLWSSSSASLPKSATPDLNALVVHCSYERSYVAPVLRGQPLLQQAMRLDLGSKQAHDMLYTDLNLHYPQYRTYLSTYRTQQVVEQFCVVSPTSYTSDLAQMRLFDLQRSSAPHPSTTAPSPSTSISTSGSFTSFSSSSSSNAPTSVTPPIVLPIRIQLPIPQVVTPAVSEEELQLKAQRRLENIERFKAQAAKRRADNLLKLRAEVQSYAALRSDRASGALTESQFLSTIRRGGFANEKDFESTYESLRRRLERSEAGSSSSTATVGVAADGNDVDTMMDGGDADTDGQGAAVPVGGSNASAAADDDDDPYPLLGVPDDKLTAEQLKEKRKQRLLKSGADARERRRLEKAELAAREREMLLREEEEVQRDRDGFLKRLRDAHQAIVDRRAERTREEQSSGGRRGGGASQKRMALLASMAEEQKRTGSGASGRRQAKTEDSFGMRDDDWLVYKDAAVPHRQLESDSESEAEREELSRIEEKLNMYDPGRAGGGGGGGGGGAQHAQVMPSPEDYQIELFVNRIRLPEMLFEPLVVGVDQCGLGEIVRRILARFDEEHAQLFAKNVFVTGGTSLYPNFVERLKNEITMIRPAGSEVCIRHANNPTLDAWLGARTLAYE